MKIQILTSYVFLLLFMVPLNGMEAPEVTKVQETDRLRLLQFQAKLCGVTVHPMFAQAIQNRSVQNIVQNCKKQSYMLKMAAKATAYWLTQAESLAAYWTNDSIGLADSDDKDTILGLEQECADFKKSVAYQIVRKHPVVLLLLAQQSEHKCGAHYQKINCLVFCKSRPLLATAADDKTVCIWDTLNRTCLRELEGWHNGWLLDPQFNIVKDRELVSSRKAAASLPTTTPQLSPDAVYFNQNGTMIVSTCGDTGSINAIGWSYIDGGSNPSDIFQGNLIGHQVQRRDGSIIQKFYAKPWSGEYHSNFCQDNPIERVLYTPDESKIVTISKNGKELAVFEAKTGRCLGEVSGNNIVNVAINDQNLLVFAIKETTPVIYQYDCKDLKQKPTQKNLEVVRENQKIVGYKIDGKILRLKRSESIADLTLSVPRVKSSSDCDYIQVWDGQGDNVVSVGLYEKTIDLAVLNNQNTQIAVAAGKQLYLCDLVDQKECEKFCNNLTIKQALFLLHAYQKYQKKEPVDLTTAPAHIVRDAQTFDSKLLQNLRITTMGQ